MGRSDDARCSARHCRAWRAGSALCGRDDTPRIPRAVEHALASRAISLSPLDRAQVRDMVVELSARHTLQRDVVDDVAARTGGVPLFIEEVTRLLLERGEQGAIEAIPLTLQQSLMARLDRLGPAREVAQIGSVIGRGFSYGLLAALTGMDDPGLQAALEKLADADILLVQGLPPESEYRFKHALIQDAAYENLLKSRRQHLHRLAAEILRDRFGDAAAAEPEMLAHHFTQAGITEEAIEWWGRAGDQALRRSAFQEALAHLGKAIEMADKEGKGAPLTQVAAGPTNQRLQLQTNYGQASLWAVGSHNRGEFASARELAETFWRGAEERSLPGEAASGLRFLGLTCLAQGDLVEARAHLENALRLYDPERDREAKFRFGTDAGATAAIYLAMATWILGDAVRSRQLSEEALARAAQSSHVPTVLAIHFFNAYLDTIRGDFEAAHFGAESLARLSREHGTVLYLNGAAMFGAWARAQLGERETGTTDFRAALAAYAEGSRAGVPFLTGLLAQLDAEGNEIEAALSRIDEAIALAVQTGERWADAFLHRIRGEILLKHGPSNMSPAEQAYLTAIAIAQQQQAKSFELRAALLLAKLYQNMGRAADAHAALASSLEGFAPTPEFPEIEEAQAMLATLPS